MRLLDHYRKLLFFALNRYEGDNYRRMREYFAGIVISEIEQFLPLWNKRVLDVGGGTGEVAEALHARRNCDAVNLDPDPGTPVWEATIVASAADIPFPDNEFDVVMSRGVLEHIPGDMRPQCIREMYRVTRPGGICYVMIPPWYNPHAGHGLKPFHTLPFNAAKFLRQLVFRKKITRTSREEFHLYPVTFRGMSRLIANTPFKMLATRDTHFRLHFMTRIPLLREVAVPAVAFVMAKE